MGGGRGLEDCPRPIDGDVSPGRPALVLVPLALALLVSLTGCLTVHGERAVLPAVTEEEAEQVLADFVEVSNEANVAYDADLNEQVETGPLGAINQAGLTARAEVNPQGNDDYEPVEFTDTRYLIPRQAGWPKYFVTDSLSNWHQENRWLLVFTRNSLREDWRASYLIVLPPSAVPEFSQDDDGYAEALPADAELPGGTGPAELSAAYTDYLMTGKGAFAAGRFTTDLLESREVANSYPRFVVQTQDQPATKSVSAPVGWRRADGGALVLFTSHHDEMKTMAEGETPRVNPLVEALMEGSAERSVTLSRVAMQAAFVPADGADVEVRHRIAGVISALGE
jgi:hypothetical protein